jgi:thioredoxin 1
MVGSGFILACYRYVTRRLALTKKSPNRVNNWFGPVRQKFLSETSPSIRIHGGGWNNPWKTAVVCINDWGRANVSLGTFKMNTPHLDQIIRQTEEPVLVQFWSPWSASCAVMTATLEALMEDPSVPFRLVRVKMDGSPGSPNPYGVLTVPTLHIFLQGELQHQIIGLTTEAKLREKLDHTWNELRKNKPADPSA